MQKGRFKTFFFLSLAGARLIVRAESEVSYAPFVAGARFSVRARIRGTDGSTVDSAVLVRATVMHVNRTAAPTYVRCGPPALQAGVCAEAGSDFASPLIGSLFVREAVFNLSVPRIGRYYVLLEAPIWGFVQETAIFSVSVAAPNADSKLVFVTQPPADLIAGRMPSPCKSFRHLAHV